ncbi:osteocalcin 2 [Tetranychus urticae]|uniref:Uncharacterized protein n=1 Tax=Tetranychus urticae TaxID=32264 RepID=T1KUV3_TETUR|nr:osteocalcin 2 [Tetranychus urticae]
MKYCLLNLIALLLVTSTYGADDHGSSVKVSVGTHSHAKDASSGSSSDAAASASAASKAGSSSSSSSSSSAKSESSETSTVSDDKDDDDGEDKSGDSNDKSAKSSGYSIHQSGQYAKLQQTVSQIASKVASHSANILSTFGDHLVGMLDDLTNRI